MSRSTFRVLSYLKRNAPKKNGLVPHSVHFSLRSRDNNKWKPWREKKNDSNMTASRRKR